jgi:plastocyanin
MLRLLVLIVAVSLTACTPSPESKADTAPAASSAANATHVEGRAASGALVMLEPAAGAPLPDGPAVLDQFSKAFVPETLFVRVGQPIIFKNSEDQLHNVIVVRTRTGTGVFNISQNQGDSYTHTLQAAGEYDVTCDVHPGMRATVVATTSPHAAYADAGGRFEFQNVPPGNYKLLVFANGRDVERAVEVGGAHANLGEIR